eukprot:9625907-Prorocentrum_lima.AAC.1
MQGKYQINKVNHFKHDKVNNKLKFNFRCNRWMLATNKANKHNNQVEAKIRSHKIQNIGIT